MKVTIAEDMEEAIGSELFAHLTASISDIEQEFHWANEVVVEPQYDPEDEDLGQEPTICVRVVAPHQEYEELLVAKRSFYDKLKERSHALYVHTSIIRTGS